MNYLSIQTLLAVYQESISPLPLLMAVWHELKISEKIGNLGVNKYTYPRKLDHKLRWIEV
ncbi:MAG: hypothetical protein DRJ03_28675 [Chloroflexi bacterium]|nr:MAG: hypothetical protein DRJ03_28675 [Chloroflexota bacterium]